MRGVLNQKNTDRIVQMALYIYLFNAVCKYFLPGILTKVLPLAAVCLAIIRTPMSVRIQLNKIDLPFLLFLFMWAVGCVYSLDMMKGLGYVLSFFLAFLLSILLRKQRINEDKVIIFLILSCLIITMFTIIQPMFPTVVSRVNHLFAYQIDEYLDMESWARNRWYSGLFPDRAPAAFYSCILIGTGLYFLCKNHKDATKSQSIIAVLLMFAGLYGMLLTAKRGLLLAALIAFFVSYIIFKYAHRESVTKIILAVATFVVMLILFLVYSETAQIIMIRFMDNDDMFTGRLVIYQYILRYIEANPIFGVGTASTKLLLGIGGHNIYLTVLMENGIFSFLFFIFAVLYCAWRTVTLALKMGKQNFHHALPFLMFSLYLQVFFMMYGMTGNPLYDNYISYFYVLALLITKNTEYQFSKSRVKG